MSICSVCLKNETKKQHTYFSHNIDFCSLDCHVLYIEAVTEAIGHDIHLQIWSQIHGAFSQEEYQQFRFDLKAKYGYHFHSFYKKTENHI
jgi:hypothetical protein